MAVKLRVPDIACESCAKTIKESIHTIAKDASVDVDVKTKTVIVESTASIESIKQAIISAGYTIENS
jgi:copper chaperone